jgi:nitrogen-specific signal transduction histidine kinase
MAGVAHEVRNPLTAIRGYVQIIRQQTTRTEHQEYLSVVLNEIDSSTKSFNNCWISHVRDKASGSGYSSMR